MLGLHFPLFRSSDSASDFRIAIQLCATSASVPSAVTRKAAMMKGVWFTRSILRHAAHPRLYAYFGELRAHPHQHHCTEDQGKAKRTGEQRPKICGID